MDDSAFEGSLILEKLAELNLLDEFWEAIDSDSLEKAKELMKIAKIDEPTIATVLKKMAEADSDH